MRNLEVAPFTAGVGNLVYGPTELLTAIAAVMFFAKVSRWMAFEGPAEFG